MRGTTTDLAQRHETLRAQRYNFEATWQRVTELILPFGGDFTRQQWPGERRTNEILDSTATWALHRGAAFFEALLTPRHEVWARCRSSIAELNEIQDVKEWFDLATRRRHQYLRDPRAQFDSQNHVGNLGLLAWGNKTLFLDAAETGGFRYRYCHLGRIQIETSHTGLVDTVYHCYPLTARQAIQRWGPNAPARAHKAMERNPLETCDYLHVVRPRGDEYDPDRVDALGKAFESIVMEIEQKELVEEGGYHEQPYIHSRYTVHPGEDWGRGPCEMVLPDVETLQEQEKTVMRSGHMAASPPWLLPDDGPLGRGQRKVNLKPNALVYGGLENGKPTVQPLQSGAQLPITIEMEQQKREAIGVALFNDLFVSLLEDRQRTATEIMRRAKEQAQLLTPTVGRQESEQLGPQITREIRILQRQGLLPPLPPALAEAGGDFEIVYENEASRMQAAEKALAIHQASEWFMAIGQGADPSVLEVPNWHEMGRELADYYGLSPKLINSREAVQKALLAQAQEKQAAQELALVQQGAEAAKAVNEAGLNAA